MPFISSGYRDWLQWLSVELFPYHQRFYAAAQFRNSKTVRRGRGGVAGGRGLCRSCFSCLLAVKATVLLYQSPTTGLFPTKTCGGVQQAKVQDSLYCAAAAWAVALAYR